MFYETVSLSLVAFLWHHSPLVLIYKHFYICPRIILVNNYIEGKDQVSQDLQTTPFKTNYLLKIVHLWLSYGLIPYQLENILVLYSEPESKNHEHRQITHAYLISMKFEYVLKVKYVLKHTSWIRTSCFVFSLIYRTELAVPLFCIRLELLCQLSMWHL